MKKYQHYINGQWVDPVSKKWFETKNPYNDEVWAHIAHGNEEDVARAVACAKLAFEGEWGEMRPTARGKLLNKLAELIERDAARLGEIEVQDNGKLLAEMGAQTKYMAEWYRYFGGLADKIEGAVIPLPRSDVFNYTLREPLGVVAAITPWNSPVMIAVAPQILYPNT